MDDANQQRCGLRGSARARGVGSVIAGGVGDRWWDEFDVAAVDQVFPADAVDVPVMVLA
ncbi:MAG TPA: hypothetical protein VFN75_01485 [Pseudonocardiaceae bacterium]|nr:hypothetical protein [Pseudonocardiaceae bacterium]